MWFRTVCDLWSWSLIFEEFQLLGWILLSCLGTLEGDDRGEGVAMAAVVYEFEARLGRLRAVHGGILGSGGGNARNPSVL